MDALHVPNPYRGRTMESGGSACAQPCSRTAALHPPVTRTPHPANSLISYLR